MLSCDGPRQETVARRWGRPQFGLMGVVKEHVDRPFVFGSKHDDIVLYWMGVVQCLERGFQVSYGWTRGVGQEEQVERCHARTCDVGQPSNAVN